MRLLAEGLDALELDSWDSGIQCESFDVGAPQVRAVVTERPGADGTVDETRYFGARAVTLGLKVYAGEEQTRRQLVDRLGSFLHPGRRPTLEWTDPTGGGLRTMNLRPAEPGLSPYVNDTLTDIAAQFVCPSGLIESATEQFAWIVPSAVAPGTGFPLTFDVSWPDFVGSPSTVINFGSTPSHWRAAIFGPCTGPIFTNENAGQSLSFPGLSIADGDYLLLDSRDRTALLNGVAGSSRYSFLDFTSSTWWQLGVGASTLTFTPDSYLSPASVLFAWRDSFYL